jgi:hypothetical protein
MPVPPSLRLILSGTAAAAMLMTVALPASAADPEKPANEPVDQTEQRAANDGDTDGDGRADVSAQGMEKADIRRATKVDAGNALNARQAGEGQGPDVAPDSRRATKVDAGNALNARQAGEGQGLAVSPANRRSGDPIPDIDITVNQGH